MWMRPLTLSAALAWAVLAAAAPARAQEPTAAHLAAARELIAVAGTGATIEGIFRTLLDGVRRQTVTRPELARDLDEVLKALEVELEPQKQQALGLAARGYAKWLTEPEIRAAATFFKSPAGAKYASVLPDLTEDVVQSLTAWSQLASEYVMTRTRIEMSKRGHQMQ